MGGFFGVSLSPGSPPGFFHPSPGAWRAPPPLPPHPCSPASLSGFFLPGYSRVVARLPPAPHPRGWSIPARPNSPGSIPGSIPAPPQGRGLFIPGYSQIFVPFPGLHPAGFDHPGAPAEPPRSISLYLHPHKAEVVSSRLFHIFLRFHALLLFPHPHKAEVVSSRLFHVFPWFPAFPGAESRSV